MSLSLFHRRDLDKIRTTAGPFTDAEEVDGPSVIENMDNMKILWVFKFFQTLLKLTEAAE